VIYGHLSLEDIYKLELGNIIEKETIIARLGAEKSLDTNGERKHLHLGIHRGPEINVRGYVDTEKELDNWIDFEALIEGN
jgi:hypothetical protein